MGWETKQGSHSWVEEAAMISDSASAPAMVMRWDREGQPGQALPVLVTWCQFELGLHFPFGDPRQLPKVVWDGSVGERLASVPGCEARHAAPWLQLQHSVKEYDLSFLPTELLEQVRCPPG